MTASPKLRGRPRLPPGEARTRAVFVSLTPAEHDVLRQLAAEVGVSVSEYVRRCLPDAVASASPGAEKSR